MEGMPRTRTLIAASGCAGLWMGTHFQIPFIVVGLLAALGTSLWGLAEWSDHREGSDKGGQNAMSSSDQPSHLLRLGLEEI